MLLWGLLDDFQNIAITYFVQNIVYKFKILNP